VDICIVGGGLCGIGIACHLKRTLKGKSIALIEKRNDIGGTW
jgi:monooxygenase